MIEVTIANEEMLIGLCRQALHKEARRVVAGSSERAGKHFALVTFPIVTMDLLFANFGEGEIKLEFV